MKATQNTLRTLGTPVAFCSDHGAIYDVELSLFDINSIPYVREYDLESEYANKIASDFLASDCMFNEPIIIKPQLIDGNLSFRVGDGVLRLLIAKSLQDAGENVSTIRCADQRFSSVHHVASRTHISYPVSDELTQVCEALKAHNFTEFTEEQIKSALESAGKSEFIPLAIEHFL